MSPSDTVGEAGVREIEGTDVPRDCEASSRYSLAPSGMISGSSVRAGVTSK